MTISLNCDAAQIKAHKAQLKKKHTDLESQIHSLSCTEAGRIRNDAEIKQLKRQKMKLKTSINACDEHLAKLDADAAKQARLKAANSKPAPMINEEREVALLVMTGRARPIIMQSVQTEPLAATG